MYNNVLFLQILAYRRAMEERLSSQPSHVSSVPDYEDADHLQMRSPHALHQLDTQVRTSLNLLSYQLFKLVFVYTQL